MRSWLLHCNSTYLSQISFGIITSSFNSHVLVAMLSWLINRKLFARYLKTVSRSEGRSPSRKRASFRRVRFRLIFYHKKKLIKFRKILSFLSRNQWLMKKKQITLTSLVSEVSFLFHFFIIWVGWLLLLLRFKKSHFLFLNIFSSLKFFFFVITSTIIKFALDGDVTWIF